MIHLAEREKTRIGLSVLGIKDGAQRTATLADLERMLGLWASVLVNVPNVRLRSDFLSGAEALATRASTFRSVVQRADPELLSLISFKEFVDFDVLEPQLDGFEGFLAWMNQEKSRRGGERRSHRKQRNDEWKQQLADWFDRYAQYVPEKERATRKARLLRLVHPAVERAVKSN